MQTASLRILLYRKGEIVNPPAGEKSFCALLTVQTLPIVSSNNIESSFQCYRKHLNVFHTQATALVIKPQCIKPQSCFPRETGQRYMCGGSLMAVLYIK